MSFIGRLFGKKTRQSSGSESRQTVTFPRSGKTVLLASNILDFCNMTCRDSETSVMILLEEYKDMMDIVMRNVGERVTAGRLSLVCTECSCHLEEKAGFMLGLSGVTRGGYEDISGCGPDEVEEGETGQCPECGSLKGLLVFSKNVVNGTVTTTDIDNLGKYFRHLAGIWWRGKTEGRTCDVCNSRVEKNMGYVYGMIEDGRLASYALWCDACAAKSLNDPGLLRNLQHNANHMGNGLVQKAREFVKGA